MITRAVAIEVQSLSKAFGDHLVVDDLSFEVPFGSIVGFVGANGSGKTTTIRALVGLTHPSTGTVRIAGKSLSALDDPRHTIGAVLDQLGAHPGVTARQHLAMVVAGGQASSRIDAVLERVGLTDAADRRIRTYSTGMKQRLALAAALVFSPSILLLDEPARGLDPAGMRWLRGVLRSSADDGAAVFISTHQLSELGQVVDQVVLIDQGRLIASEAASQLLERTGCDRLDDAVLQLLGVEEPDEVRTRTQA